MTQQRDRRRAKGAAVSAEAGSAQPHWSQILRALREARGITREGWAARLGYGRATLQRWERGETVPDATAESALVALCTEFALFRPFDQGPLSGHIVTPEWLSNLLAEARISGKPPSEAAEHERGAQEARPAGVAEAQPGLPASLSTFVGRETELTTVARLLEDHRLLTLTGPGGVGKTRLALALANDAEALRGRFPDGIFFVPLAPISDPGLVIAAIAQALGMRELPSQPLEASLIAELRHKQRLLILDNFEHLIAASTVVSDLLAACPDLSVLVCSRTLLRLSGEQDYPVPPLQLPDAHHRQTDASLGRCEAVRLFLDRAAAVRPDFRLTDTNAEAVAAICERLNGLPLAIELAAARARILTPKAILSRLESGLTLLQGGARDFPDRHQSLHATIAWSHDLLETDEQLVFRRLAVFVGGWTLPAAEAVCVTEADASVDALEVLTSLTEKSLVQQASDFGDEPRFVMLETIREFARQQLADSGEAEEAARRHAEYFAHMAEELEPHLTSPERMPWLQRMAADQENLRAALSCSIEQDDGEVGLRILDGARALYWLAFREGRRWADRILPLPSAQRPTVARAKALAMAGQVAYAEGDLEAMHAWAEEATAIGRERGHDEYLTLAMCNLLLSTVDQLDRSREIYGDAKHAATRRDDSWLLGFLDMCYGAHMAQEGQCEVARTHAAEAIRRFERLDDTWMLAMSGNVLGLSELQLGDLESAQRHLRASLPAHLKLGDRHSAIVALTGAALCARLASEDSLVTYREALALCRDSGDVGSVALCLEGVAANVRAAGNADRAASILGAASRVNESGAAAPLPGFEVAYERTLSSVCETLEEQAFLAAFERGRALTLDAAIGLALDADAD